jgi:hypothetical protein
MVEKGGGEEERWLGLGEEEKENSLMDGDERHQDQKDGDGPVHLGQ